MDCYAVPETLSCDRKYKSQHEIMHAEAPSPAQGENVLVDAIGGSLYPLCFHMASLSLVTKAPITRTVCNESEAGSPPSMQWVRRGQREAHPARSVLSLDTRVEGERNGGGEGCDLNTFLWGDPQSRTQCVHRPPARKQPQGCGQFLPVERSTQAAGVPAVTWGRCSQGPTRGVVCFFRADLPKVGVKFSPDFSSKCCCSL